MSEPSDIPAGTYSLTLGDSFEPAAGKTGRKNDRKVPNFHTLRYDFKPSSVSNDSETYIAFGATGDVHVSVPNDSDSLTVFKGSKKEAKPKECLLFFDKNTNTVRLEKITSSINVKKTRDLDPGTDLALKRGIEKLRTKSDDHGAMASSSPEQNTTTNPNNFNMPESSDSSSDSDDASSDSNKSNGDSSDDDAESALIEQLNRAKAPTVSAHNHGHQEQAAYSAPPPPAYGNNTSIRDKGNSEKYGLDLSESSEDED
uniref:Ell-associated factor Eaf n=1 Tax=Caenorhabditis japonica TaxID=281687 RepID=A0A8R1DHY1_CAEJA